MIGAYITTFLSYGHLALSQKYVHESKYNEIVNIFFFHLAINIFVNNSNFHFTLQVLKSQRINASCHHALCCVIIMNPMIHMCFYK